MLDQLKQFMELKKIKDVIDKIEKEVEVNGVKVIINGKLQIKAISLNPDLDQVRQEQAVKECVNAAFMQIQQEITAKMRSANLGI